MQSDSILFYRYLDNVVNKQTVAPPIPHLHALLTSGDDPPPEIDVFELIKSSYEVRLMSSIDDISKMHGAISRGHRPRAA